MPVKEQKRNHVELDVNQLDDQGLLVAVSAVLQAAPTSALYAGNPAIQSSVNALAAAHAAHKAASDTVIADRTKLATDTQLESDARFVVVNGMVQLKSLTETTAKTPADISSMGFSSLVRQTPGIVEVPGIAVYLPKDVHGRAKVSATVSSSARGCRFNAQVCVDPVAQNTWTDLEGDARTHWLTTFKSGTVVWVRFRCVRGRARSDWSAPVPVTIP